MNGAFQRRLRVLLGAAVTAFACWKTIPGTQVDRFAFTTAVRGFANPPFFINGNGSHPAPWNLRTFATRLRIDSRQAPVIVSLGDDLEGFFQSSPPSPIDLAVIFNNFQRLGARKAATAAVLAWDAPDPIGLMALEKAIGRFDSLVMAAPLSRGAASESMPPAFRMASIPTTAVQGDGSLFPVVNRVPLSGIILGTENSLAGFQSIDTAPSDVFIQLVARWEDRLVFAFPLLVALQRLDLPLNGVEIRPGEYIKLSPAGPLMPLDRYGRLAVPLKRISPYAEFPAEALIDGVGDLFPKQAPEPIILRDDRSSAESATREFSRALPFVVSTLTSDTALAPAHIYPRLSSKHEIGILSLFILILTGICGLPTFARNVAYSAIAGFCIATQCIAIGSFALWLPGIAVLASILAASIVSLQSSISPSMGRLVPVSPQPRPSIPPVAAPSPQTESEPAESCSNFKTTTRVDPPSEKHSTKTQVAKTTGKLRKKRRR